MAVNIGINIQRSPNRINQELREAGAAGKYPKLLLDFKDEYYLANGGSKTFANAVTHARAGNATMTDGYGPELVTNGGFDSDSDWTKGTGWSIFDGKGTKSAGTASGLDQSISLDVGKTYVVSYRVINRTAGSVQPKFTGGSNVNGIARSADGYYQDFLTTVSGNNNLQFLAGTSFSGSIDNVSVREMPVIKWAPHNYQEHSDDVSQGSGSLGVTRTATTLTETTSTGEHRIQCGINAPIVGEKYTMALEAKSGTGSRLIGFRGFGHGGIGNYPVFDIVNGTIETVGANFTDVSITDVGDGYYLCKASTVVGSSFKWSVHMIEDGTPPQHNYTGDGSSSVLLRKLRQYRSDLGGMVDNPDNSGNDADFIATSGSAAQLPRIGHHVYNGSAWVNEGVLAESESRTNLATKSGEFSTWAINNSTVTDNAEISPDGTTSASTVITNTATGEHFVQLNLTPDTGTFTDSFYVKANGYKRIFVRPVHVGATEGNTQNIQFNIETGTLIAAPSGTTGTIQDVGNGWYRVAATFTVSGSVTTPYGMRLQILDDSGTSNFTGDGTSGIQIYGAQREEASTPSSYIPTSGSSVTRAAETFTIPSANLPWPEPNYIGSELVTNGTFDLNTAGWTGILGASLSYVAGSYGTWMRVTEDGVDGSTARAYQTITTEVGKVYGVSIDYLGGTGTGSIYINTSSNFGGAIAQNTNLDSGTNTLEFVATSTTTYVIVGAGPSAGVYNDYDNISVREIDPLSVSIAMDGRMTFADTGNANEALHYRWFDDIENRIQAFLSTYGTLTGGIYSYMEYQDTADSAGTAGDYYTPDILTPYNMAARYGSTFVNAAHEGVALTANTTPVGLPDLSSTDMTIAHVYMGTISEFRVWDKDITDDGLVEATNPSLEPSLSLTFEGGTGTNSFVVNDWSE